MIWSWLSKELGVAKPDQHVFELAVSLLEDDGQLGVLRCKRCGYCTYLKDSDKEHPRCTPRAHRWSPRDVFQWDHLSLANKLPQPLQCDLCGAFASTREDWERFGCPGQRQKEDP
jgi:hypothetical protein